MKMKVKLFTALRDAAGLEDVFLSWRQGMTPRDVLQSLREIFHPMSALLDVSFVAINGRYAAPGAVLMPEDEVAVLPPVSGG